MAFLPTTREEMEALGWDRPDFLFISGDAYVDHPSFGHAIISRVLEKHGFRVGIIPQPDWRNAEDFKRLGKPRLGVLVSSGVIDSMVNHYTAAKKPRKEDLYSPGGKAGYRPDRAVIVYCNRIREAFKDIPLILGGLEASLRRFAHYDYWDDKVRRSVLLDSKADIISYGMGEHSIVEIAKLLDKGVPVRKINHIRGTAFLCNQERLQELQKTDKFRYIQVPSYEMVSQSKMEYAKAFQLQYQEQEAVTGKALIQAHGEKYVVQNPPGLPLSVSEMDQVYALPYERTYHPSYEPYGGIPAISEVKFSITSQRGCFGGCSFCALHFHQGRVIQKRSEQSILNEAKKLTWMEDFKGYINDVGGPTANFRNPACEKQLEKGACKKRQCMWPTPCKHLKVDHMEYLKLLRKLRELPKIKKVFVRSGIRFDYLMLDKNDTFFKELCKHHISGQLKVAPEHVSDKVLMRMGKPGVKVYDSFVQKYRQMNQQLGKEQYIVPYLMSSHPGSGLEEAVDLAVYLRKNKYKPEQVQDFYPTPATLSTCMFYTGIDPRDMRPVYVAKERHEKELQRALLQSSKPENRKLVMEALKKAGREDLIGTGEGCLISHYEYRKTREDLKNGKDHRRKGSGTESQGRTQGRSGTAKTKRSTSRSGSDHRGKQSGLQSVRKQQEKGLRRGRH